MITLKRIVVWLVERLLEACILGGLFMYLMIRAGADIPRGTLATRGSEVLIFGLVVAVMLFVHGYYVTTAMCGVIWRSPKPWVYPMIMVALFAVHTHIIFLRGKPDFTPEVRAMELPFVGGGAFVVFACSRIGNEALKRWQSVRPSANPYLSAAGLTLLFFLLLNTANFLRPIIGDSSFRPYGLPFTFYREGGFVREWVWREGVFVWWGLIADVAVVVAVIALAGNVSERIRLIRKTRRG
jgi:hypothetical protein